MHQKNDAVTELSPEKRDVQKKNWVKVRPKPIATHRTWALALTIFCFFLLGPCWALWKSTEIRRLLKEKDFEGAERLSNRVADVLITSSVMGGFAWVAILFCSAGLLLTGKLLLLNYI